jgi:phytase-like protein
MRADFTMRWKNPSSLFVAWLTCLWASAAVAAEPAAAEVLRTGTLPPVSLSTLQNPALSPAALDQARRNGLRFTDRPSIGSGLAKVGENEFIGITDRGPNGMAESDDDDSRRTFPLPQFCPTIVRFKLEGSEIRITGCIPLRDREGRLLTGLSNGQGEEPLYGEPEAKTPLAFDPSGVDPEAIRVFPDGSFLLSEEYSPSIFVVSSNGQVLVRYTPASKPLPGAAYPVKAILPDVFAQRRSNKGFENLALSADGRFAWAILQGPMGDVKKKRYEESRVIRVLKLDVSRPLDATVVGEYLALASLARDYSPKQEQEKVYWSDAEWIGPDRLLVLERGKGEGKVLLVDLSRATNILGRQDAAGLGLEDVKTDLPALGIQTATSQVLCSTRKFRQIDSDKLEGLTVLSPTEIAITSDNDFGIGDNKTGEPSKLWIVRLGHPLSLADSR